MRAFPAAPCCVDVNNQLRALAPSAECPIAEENLAKGLLDLGHAGKVGISCTRSAGRARTGHLPCGLHVWSLCLLSFVCLLPSKHSGSWLSNFAQDPVSPGPRGLRTCHVHSHWRQWRRWSLWPHSHCLCLCLRVPPRLCCSSRPRCHGSLSSVALFRCAPPPSLQSPVSQAPPPLLAATPSAFSSSGPSPGPDLSCPVLAVWGLASLFSPCLYHSSRGARKKVTWRGHGNVLFGSCACFVPP